MSTHIRPTGAASELTDPSEGPGTGVAAVEALARILDPEAFDPDSDVFEGRRPGRRAWAIAYATRAIAAGYRLVEEES